MNNQNHSVERFLSFKHSGNLGDVLYSIPGILAHVSVHSPHAPPQLYLQAGVKARYSGSHPLGDILLSEAYIERIKPLLNAQGYFRSVNIYSGERIDVDLDEFRNLPISFKTGTIPYWYFWLLDGVYDLSTPWIHAEEDMQFRGFIFVSRTFRLRSRFIDYSFMNNWASKIIFCGVKEEWDDFRRVCSLCRNWVQFEDFLQYARALKGAEGFVGNQGFGFTLAEAMKVPRILESNEIAPNNSPSGGWYRSCLFQDKFELAFGQLLDLV